MIKERPEETTYRYQRAQQQSPACLTKDQMQPLDQPAHRPLQSSRPEMPDSEE